jgi:putative hydrolase of the HAD superfamily
MTEAVIFDFGNVIAQFNNQNFIQYLAALTNKTPEELNDAIYPKSETSIPKQYETGLITSDEFFEKIKILVNFEMSKEKFSEIYTQEKFWPIPETFGLIRKLKNQRYKISLLSNTSEWDYQLGMKPIFERVGIEFDSQSLSFKIGAMKPDKRIYLHALESLSLSADQCVYIDDIEKYAKVAEELGMIGVHYTHGKDNLENQLREKGVKV